MSRSSDLPPALRTLLDVGAVLLRRSASGQVLLGRAAGAAAPAALPWVERSLAQARTAVSTPLAPRTVEKTLRVAWKRAPARVLDELDLEAPAVCTPVAQIHRAELDGRAVAVKVRRPGLDAQVRADLALLEGLRVPLAALLPGLDAGALFGQIRERALDELDLEHEATQQRAARRALRGGRVEVPAVHSDLAAPEVMVSDWLDGPTLAQERPADPPAVARTLVDAHLEAARTGLVLCDPRPNHVVLLADGRLGLLGTGAAVAADRDRLRGLIGLADALRHDDPDQAAELAGALDLGITPEATRAAYALARTIRDDPAPVARALESAGPLLAVMRSLTPAPADVWPARMGAQLGATLAGLAASSDAA